MNITITKEIFVAFLSNCSMEELLYIKEITNDAIEKYYGDGLNKYEISLIKDGNKFEAISSYMERENVELEKATASILYWENKIKENKDFSHWSANKR